MHSVFRFQLFLRNVSTEQCKRLKLYVTGAKNIQSVIFHKIRKCVRITINYIIYIV